VNFFGIGGFELIIIAGLAFFLLGPKKMIETSRSAGKLIRELKAERDKFTNMIMSEFDDADDKPSGAKQSSAATGPEVTPEAPVDAVSRPRGRMQGLADEGSSDVPEDDTAETSEDDDPDTAAGGSA
jgi:Sec-independent protein translocase protein TatA